MSDPTIEQRLAALEAKVEVIEVQLRLSPPGKVRSPWFDRPPLTQEELAAHEEVHRCIREAREAELANFDRGMQRDRGDPSEGDST